MSTLFKVAATSLFMAVSAGGYVIFQQHQQIEVLVESQPQPPAVIIQQAPPPPPPRVVNWGDMSRLPSVTPPRQH